MQALPSLLLLLASRWTRGLVGASIISALIWSFLPQVAFFQPPLRRVVAILAVFAVFGGVTAALAWRAKRRRRAVEQAIEGAGDGAATGPGRAGDTEAAAEVAALRTRLREALAALRKRGVRRAYELPWYVVIGPPGSGKTTALRQSGLHFPLEGGDEGPLAGVGGTRLCDWWFSEEAVLIDTAGRYTTQDSNRSVDKAGWLGFLDLLRRTRPRQPVNGVIVVIALTELLGATDEQRGAHARAIRGRIDELTERLRVRIPVYLVVSKMDRLAGFDMFFDHLDAAGRAQVWGVTFGLDEGVGAFGDAFRALLDRIDARLIDRLEAERGHDRRALMSGFPLQFASIEGVLTSFLAGTFSGSRIDPAPFLRGVYLTSATQNGTPFDRLHGMLQGAFDIDQRQAPALRPAAARGYFLARMTREVILGETPLVSTSPGRYRRRVLLRAGGLAAIGVGTLVGLGVIWGADVEARVAIDREADALAAYRQAVDKVPAQVIASDGDLAQVSALLDQAASLSQAGREPIAGLIGVSPRPALVQAGRTAYADALDHLLYPRLVWRVEQTMRAQMQDPDALYEATRIYLLLGGDGPPEPDAIRAWFAQDWSRRFAGVLDGPLRAHLAAHLDALLSEPLPSSQLPLDGALVNQARTAFSHVTPAQRIYDRLRARAVDQGGLAPDWSPAIALGAGAERTFVYADGSPLSSGVPGYLTGRAFAELMERDLPPAARLVSDESWVVGRDPGIATGSEDVEALERQVSGLWAREALAAWSRVLDGLDLLPFAGRAEAERGLYLLSSPQSPLREMLVSIAHALQIAKLPDDEPNAAVAAAWTAHWAPILALVNIPANPPDASKSPSGSGQAAGPGPAPIDDILRLVGSLDNELATGNNTPGALPMVAQASADPSQLLIAEASRQPHPLSQWLQEIATAGSGTLGEEARSAASGAYNQQGGPAAACRALVEGRYPFDRGSDQDASLADFARVLAPGGMLDTYFQTSVAPYVDVSFTPWRVHPAGGVAPPFTAAQLAPFERAAAIRRAFFPAGATPTLYLTMELAAPTGVSLKLGGVTVAPGGPATVIWPGSDGLSPAVLQQTPAKGGTPTAIASEHGTWALFRLLGDAAPVSADDGPGSATRQYAFGSGAATSTLSVDAGGSGGGSASGRAKLPNPLDPGLLAGFTCPAVP